MEADFENMDLFCRINAQSEMPHGEFVSFIADCVGGRRHLNTVTSDKLDISVDDNDVFDAEKSRTGKDRWLYFRYSLDIDPAEGVSPGDYVAAIGNLLQSLWASRVEAVASCDFEEQLPRKGSSLNGADLAVARELPLGIRTSGGGMAEK